MHVLTLPPRHLVRVTLLAASLALAVTALLAAPLGPAARERRSAPQAGGVPVVTGPALPHTTAVRPPLAPKPAWLANPVAPPSLGAAPGHGGS